LRQSKKPAAHHGYRFEPGVPEELLDRLVCFQARGQEIQLESVEPVQLQVVCAWLAQLCRNHHITHEDLQPLGNFDGVLRDSTRIACARSCARASPRRSECGDGSTATS
jgi:hypothetical protein